MGADDLLGQATRCLAAIRITVRKAPEVLVVEFRETMVVDWLLVRMCFVLYQVIDGGIRGEIISTLAEVFKIGKEAVPRTGNDLQKCIETIKSWVSCTFLYSRADDSDSSLYGYG